MANKTCLDCSMLDPVQGMEAHPIFSTEYDWLMHLHKAHGRPKPTPPGELKELKESVTEVTRLDRPRPMDSEVDQIHDRIDNIRLDIKRLEERTAALETQDTGLLDRIAALEKPANT